jgi:WD40 repeat protein
VIASTSRIFVVSLAVVASLVAAGTAQASFPGDNGRIAFTRDIHFCSDPPAPCGKVLMSVNPDGLGATQVAAPGDRAAASADGVKLAYTDGLKIYVSNTDGSSAVQVLDWGAAVGGLAWSPDGQKLAGSLETCSDDECRPDIYTFNLDGSGLTDVTPDLAPDRDPSWSPDGSKIVFSTPRSSNYEVFVMNPDGTGATNVSNNPATDFDPNWSPTGDRIAFVRSDNTNTDLWLMNPDGSGQQRLTNTVHDQASLSPSWSPDGTSIAYGRGLYLRTIHVIDVQSAFDTQITSISGDHVDDYPEWLQAAPPPQEPPSPYARPRGATPFKAYFVPAFQPCVTPNSTHGEPLAFGSCNPPVQASDQLTIGTPDANGAAARAVGWLLLRVLVGRPSTPFDDADAEVIFDTGDVRNAGSLTDYQGEVSLGATIRITDRTSEPGPTSATVEDIPVNMAVPCGATSDPGRGSSCRLDTTIDGIFGNVIVEGARTIWELGQMRVDDGGPDGVADTQPNGVFEVQGLFVP